MTLNTFNSLMMETRQPQIQTLVPNGLSYKYSLNSENQARRLVTLKPPISVTYNNFKTVDNVRHAFNVNVECNSGVYLTAIKPVLETVTTGWTADVDNWTVSCSKVSPRLVDKGKHLLCTQLALIISSKNQQDTSIYHLTLHFYHTKDKVQVQGSSILYPGISAATWLVKHFIEPLAASHVANNQQSIDQVNSAIISTISSRTWSCDYCLSNIELTATQVKEQPLPCKKCNKMFHKKCTNRRAVRGGNWNKEPWYCPLCTAAEHSPVPAVLPDDDNVLSTVVLSTHIGAQRPSLLAEDNSIIDVNIAADEPVMALNPVASGSHHPAPPSSLSQIRRFPNNSIRQENIQYSCVRSRSRVPEDCN
jgi:hypothetical protein